MNILAVQAVFAILTLVTGVIGTFCQVVATWLNQLGGPRERHVAAVLLGMAGTTPQDIYIADRRLISLAATTLTSYGSAVLFAAVVAGLAINFPQRWPIGLALWVALLITSSVLILRSSYLTTLRLRTDQETLFDSLPMDGDQEVVNGHIYETAAYRSEILTNKPDLAIKISSLSGVKRLGFLIQSTQAIYRRERRRT